VPAVNGVFGVEDVSDRQVPVVLNKIHPLTSSVWAGGVCAGLRHFHPARENRGVGGLQFVPHLDGEVDGAGVRRTLIFRYGPAAAFEAVATLVYLAVEFQRRPCTWNSVFDIVLVAAVTAAGEAEFEFGNPAPHVPIIAVE